MVKLKIGDTINLYDILKINSRNCIVVRVYNDPKIKGLWSYVSEQCFDVMWVDANDKETLGKVTPNWCDRDIELGCVDRISGGCEESINTLKVLYGI